MTARPDVLAMVIDNALESMQLSGMHDDPAYKALRASIIYEGRHREPRIAALEASPGCAVDLNAMPQGNYGMPDGSRVIGWRLSPEQSAAMGPSAHCLPREIGEDLTRLQSISTWWEAGAAERMASLQKTLAETFPDDRQSRRDLWDAILPLIHAIAAPKAGAPVEGELIAEGEIYAASDVEPNIRHEFKPTPQADPAPPVAGEATSAASLVLIVRDVMRANWTAGEVRMCGQIALAVHAAIARMVAAKDSEALRWSFIAQAQQKRAEAMAGLADQWRSRADELIVSDHVSLTHQLNLRDCAHELDALRDGLAGQEGVG